MSSLNEFTRKKIAHLWPITLLRVYTGVFFFYYGFGKVINANFADGLSGFVSGNLENCFGFIRPFLESVVLPNSGVFAFLVSWGELLIGGALVVGLATRYASIAGAVMVASWAWLRATRRSRAPLWSPFSGLPKDRDFFRHKTTIPSG